MLLIHPDWRQQLFEYVIYQLPNLKVETKTYALAVHRAAPSVVNISTRQRITLQRHPLFDDPLFRYFFDSSDLPRQQRMSSALGSGVIINDEGYLLTNNHVVQNADEIFVSLYNGENVQAHFIGSDQETDLAVLKIESDAIQPITLGEPHQALVGDVVLAIGNPFNLGQTVTQGIISATGRYGLGLSVYENFLQTDAAINPGNSGGALIDTSGKLLGINTAILNRNQNNTSIGIGFAIPADIAVNIMSDIISTGRAVRGWLGIEARSINPNLVLGKKRSATVGILITGVYPNGPADQSGLQPGDILMRINDQTIRDGRQAMNLIAQTRPGDQVHMDIFRKRKALKLAAEAGRRPTQFQ